MECHYPTCLTIAGSDSSGGAGIQADLKTMSALGVYGMSVITAVTAQNTCGVTGIQAITPDIVKAQLEAVFSDIACDAVKIGMLFSVETIAATIDMLDKYAPLHIVLDPVLVSTSGHRLYGDDHLVDALKAGLFPRATLITPNTEEAALLSGIAIHSEPDMYRAGEVLLGMGCRAVLIKGGHLMQQEMNDILFTLFGYRFLFGFGQRVENRYRSRETICPRRSDSGRPCDGRPRPRSSEPSLRPTPSSREKQHKITINSAYKV